eukprot:5376322-Alexandrium_andersonii.AAC.1
MSGCKQGQGPQSAGSARHPAGNSLSSEACERRANASSGRLLCAMVQAASKLHQMTSFGSLQLHS